MFHFFYVKSSNLVDILLKFLDMLTLTFEVTKKYLLNAASQLCELFTLYFCAFEAGV